MDFAIFGCILMLFSNGRQQYCHKIIRRGKVTRENPTNGDILLWNIDYNFCREVCLDVCSDQELSKMWCDTLYWQSSFIISWLQVSAIIYIWIYCTWLFLKHNYDACLWKLSDASSQIFSIGLQCKPSQYSH